MALKERFFLAENFFVLPAGAAAGDSEARLDELKIHFFRAWSGRN
jgi:hypothetical protein